MELSIDAGTKGLLGALGECTERLAPLNFVTSRLFLPARGCGFSSKLFGLIICPRARKSASRCSGVKQYSAPNAHSRPSHSNVAISTLA
jgi:hypothetical protein